jgi:hypothetical protein
MVTLTGCSSIEYFGHGYIDRIFQYWKFCHGYIDRIF